MGSIPVRSTKKHRMQNCIRCFLVLLLVNPSSVRQYGKAVFLPRGLPLAGNGKFPHISTKTSLQFCIRCFLILFLVNSSSVRQYGEAVFLPRGSRLRETAKPYHSNNKRQKNMESIINPRIIPKFDKNKPAYYP